MPQSTTKKFIKKAIQRDLIDQNSLELFKKEFCRELRITKTKFRVLSNADIKKTYLKMLAGKEIELNSNL